MFIIGERINPAGKSELACAIREGKKTLIQQEALVQERSGAQALDINVFVPGIERIQAIRMAVESVRSVSQLPLVIDDRDPNVVEAGLRYAGKNALINSPVDSEGGNTKIFSLADEFNAKMLILPMIHNRIPISTAEHIQLSRIILERLKDYGIPRERVAMDAILLALKQAKEKVMETLERIKQLKAELGVRAVIGLSNISYQLKNRGELNARFLRLAKGCGIDFVICDPLQKEVMTIMKNDIRTPHHSETKRFLEYAESCWV